MFHVVPLAPQGKDFIYILQSVGKPRRYVEISKCTKENYPAKTFLITKTIILEVIIYDK